jgi:AmmeMemoRadiSam system protein A
MNNPYINLAKSAVEIFIKEGRIINLPEDLPREFLERKAGTFVTIEKQLRGLPRTELRGCIGTYLPTKENIAKEVIYNAIAASTEDYRFGPITEKELPELSYTVYILSEPELVKDVSELDPKKFGVIVKVVFNGHIPYKTGLLLPDLKEIDTAEQQIAIACQKGGIDLLKEKILIYCFTVEQHKEI